MSTPETDAARRAREIREARDETARTFWSSPRGGATLIVVGLFALLCVATAVFFG